MCRKYGVLTLLERHLSVAKAVFSIGKDRLQHPQRHPLQLQKATFYPSFCRIRGYEMWPFACEMTIDTPLAKLFQLEIQTFSN